MYDKKPSAAAVEAAALANLLIERSKLDPNLRVALGSFAAETMREINFNYVHNWAPYLPHLKALAQTYYVPSQKEAPHINVKVDADAPEMASIHFSTTGMRGGNWSHGASASLKIIIEGGAHQLLVDDEIVRDEETENYTLELQATGDWEIHGLAEALVELGKQLEPLVRERRRQSAVQMLAYVKPVRTSTAFGKEIAPPAETPAEDA
jgi:hypothetical protein